VRDPNIAFNLRISDAVSILNASDLKPKYGVSDIKMVGERQIIFADVALDKQFTQEDLSEPDESTRDLVERWKPQIKGKTAIGMGLTSASAIAQDGEIVISFRLLPLFRNIQVDEVCEIPHLERELVKQTMKMSNLHSVGQAFAATASPQDQTEGDTPD
jgi:hypothetical protein